MSGQLVYQTGNGWVPVQQDQECNTTIENKELAVLLAKGIYDFFYEEINCKGSKAEKAFDKIIEEDSVYCNLESLRYGVNKLETQIRNLKWYQLESTLLKKIDSLQKEAYVLVKDFVPWAYKNSEVYEFCNTYYRFVQNKHSKRRERIDQSTILAVVLSTPDFNKKTFSELSSIVKEQLNK